MGPSPKLAAKLPQIRLVCSPECKRSLEATRIKGALVSGSDDDPPQIVDQTTSAAVDECSPTFEYLGSSAGCGICEGECRHPFAKVSVVTLFLQVADGCEMVPAIVPKKCIQHATGHFGSMAYVTPHSELGAKKVLGHSLRK